MLRHAGKALANRGQVDHPETLWGDPAAENPASVDHIKPIR
jgi:hypothetical protein